MTTVCNEIVYPELDVVSFKVRVMSEQLRFWNNVLELEKDNPLMYTIREVEKHKQKKLSTKRNSLRRVKLQKRF